jgi:hypothetical protein
MGNFTAGFMTAIVIVAGILFSIPWYWFTITGLVVILLALLPVH